VLKLKQSNDRKRVRVAAQGRGKIGSLQTFVYTRVWQIKINLVEIILIKINNQIN
jgi:hypothetical protein